MWRLWKVTVKFINWPESWLYLFISFTPYSKHSSYFFIFNYLDLFYYINFKYFYFYSIIYYILTKISPPFSNPSFSPFSPQTPHPLFLFRKGQASSHGRISTKHRVSSCNETRHYPLY